MNISKFNISLAAAAMMLGGLALSGCVAEEPFGGADGEGVLKMRMVINSDITRAEFDDDTEAALRSNCVVYISDPQKGLLHKFKGLENLPEQINMKSGSYVAEAWTGDSVSASFDKKFFRGYQPFQVNQGVNQVVVNCKIANVVASVNSATIDPEMVKDMKITVANTRGSLDFDASNYDFAKGYFMMPDGDTSLKYTVSGVNLEGKGFEKTGVIENVERAHEYVLNFSYNPDYEEMGGSFITITIDNTEIVVEDEVEILSRPAVSLVDLDIDRQVTGAAGGFTNDLIVKACAFGGVKKLSLRSQQAPTLGLPMAEGQEIDLMNLTPSAEDAVNATGITHDVTFNEGRNLATCFLIFPTSWLNKIPEADEEYVIDLTVEDNYGKTTEKKVRIAVGEGAVVVEDPVILGQLSTLDLLAVGSKSATIPVTVNSDNLEGAGVRYRESGTESWTEVMLSSLSAAPRKVMRKAAVQKSVTLSNLKPGTRYEVQAFAPGFVSQSQYITTEPVFTIPNASMEDWSTYSAKTMLGTKTVSLPGSTGDKETSFWGSGNEGGATANKTMTSKSGDMFHSGSSSARLESKSALSFLAAGNLFVGTYVKTDGTDGVLKLGRQYDGSHPAKLGVWVNYRPATVNIVKSGMDSYIPANFKGGNDHGQIYVALTTEPVDVRTKDKTFLKQDAAYVVAYGEHTFQGNFGSDGSLEYLEIPINYKEIAKSTKPLYLVIVCAASKYGDYFCGGEGSTMYLDDFELVYE